MKTNVIHTGDSAEILKSFPDECIDLSVQSPPYDNLRTYKGFVYDFETIASQLYRVTKTGGVVVWVIADATVNGSETGTSFRNALYFMQCGFNLHDTMIYETDKQPLNSNRYEPKFEYMFVFSKGAPKSFNPIMEKSIYAGRKNKPNTFNKDGSKKEWWGNGGIKDTKVSGNVWYIVSGSHKSTMDDIDHPAIFPEELARKHILSWSNEGDLILDCFTGSGTTLKAAKQLNRNYVGIEISPEYVAMAEKRLLATNVPLFGQGQGLTLPAPDGGDSAPSQALSTPDMFSAIEHEPTPAPRR